jgi:hypothetical protein
MRYPNLAWACSQVRLANYEVAAQAEMSESRFSRCLTGRFEFSEEEKNKLAKCLGYPASWLFQAIQPPARIACEENQLAPA